MRYIRFPARFLRRLTALVLALSVCLCAAPAASASDWSGVLNEDRLLPAMLDFFKGTEGSYGSVNPNDNGALSVGILQWHGVRALRLVRRVIRADPDAIWNLPASLRSEIRDENATWNSRTLTPAEKTALSALLAAPSGVAAQDAQAREDLTDYIDLAWSAGMRSDAGPAGRRPTCAASARPSAGTRPPAFPAWLNSTRPSATRATGIAIWRRGSGLTPSSRPWAGA